MTDKYVTYDAVKPYIEKTCYSVEYPFLTKETVKNKNSRCKKTSENTHNHYQDQNSELAKMLDDMGLVL